MSTQTPTSDGPAGVAVSESGQPQTITVLSRKTPVIMAVVTVGLALAVLLGAQEGTTSFRLSTPDDLFSLPTLTVPAEVTALVLVALMALCTAEAVRRYLARHGTPLWLVTIFSVCGLIAFLSWAAAGGTIPVVGLLGGSLLLAVPLVFGALGGVLGERVGVVNIAIDGQLLAGAFAAAMIGSITGSPWIGIIAAMAAGTLVALILGLFAISYFVDQVIVGVVLNVLVIGFTSFMFSQVLAENTEALNTPPRLTAVAIPVLSEIPLLGPIFFDQSPIVYLLYVAVAAVTFALYRTRWGLRLRAVGEHPKAADTVGINVNRTRYRTVLLAGAVAGAGGAFYTLVSVQAFNREMTGGAGYIALAAVIFG